MMLKIESIKFQDSKGKEYLIKKNQLETFHLQGGESANMITTESWNQHGNTPINAWMEPFDSDLVFIIRTRYLEPEQIAEERRKITNICNPLNDTVRMIVTLNDGSIYNRDITFTSAPIFPTGFENRNRDWQKVQLLYSANNPFWFAENQIIETFQGVEPMFNFPFSLEGKTIFEGIEMNYFEKIRGSDVENPNASFSTNLASLPSNYAEMGSEVTQATYDALSHLEGVLTYKTSTDATLMPMFIFKWNVIEHLQRRYGSEIWNGATTLADKIARANSIITKFTWWVNGFGILADGTNKMSLAILKDDFTNFTSSSTDTTFANRGINSSATNNIHGDGCSYFVAFTDAGMNAEVRVQMAWLDLDLNIGANGTEVVFGNVIPSNVALNEGQVQAPVLIKIKGACVNPKITNETTGEFIAFKDLTMNTGDELIIDTTFGQKKVELNGVNVFNKLDFSSTFFNLEIGENSIDFSDETGTNETDIHFIYKNLYITI